MSFDKTNLYTPTSFVFDVVNVNKVQSYLGFPRMRYGEGEPETALFITENFSDHIYPRTVEVMNAGKGLDKVYECLSNLPENLHYDALADAIRRSSTNSRRRLLFRIAKSAFTSPHSSLTLIVTQ